MKFYNFISKFKEQYILREQAFRFIYLFLFSLSHENEDRFEQTGVWGKK